MNGGWPEGRNPFFSGSSNFSVNLVFFHEFGEFCKIREFSKIHELWETCGFCSHCLGTG